LTDLTLKRSKSLQSIVPRDNNNNNSNNNSNNNDKDSANNSPSSSRSPRPRKSSLINSMPDTSSLERTNEMHGKQSAQFPTDSNDPTAPISIIDVSTVPINGGDNFNEKAEQTQQTKQTQTPSTKKKQREPSLNSVSSVLKKAQFESSLSSSQTTTTITTTTQPIESKSSTTETLPSLVKSTSSSIIMDSKMEEDFLVKSPLSLDRSSRAAFRRIASKVG